MIKLLLGNTTKLALVDGNRLSIALLILRVFVGAAMMGHGFGKIQTPFSWMPPEAPIPGILQALAAFAEFGGGLALIIGLLFPLAAFGLAITMAVAAFFHIGKGDAFFGGYELAALYLVIMIFFVLVGPGRYSLDAVLLKRAKL